MITHLQNPPFPSEYNNWICPDIRAYWKLYQLSDSPQIILYSPQNHTNFYFSSIEGYALQFFTGIFTIKEIQNHCQDEFPNSEPHLVFKLVQKLITLGIIAPISNLGSNQRVGCIRPSYKSRSSKFQNLTHPTIICQLRKSCTQINPIANNTGTTNNQLTDKVDNNNFTPQLKPGVEWIRHGDGYWILRNSEDFTFLQVSQRDYRAISQLGKIPTPLIIQNHNISPNELNKLLKLLAATGMLAGTKAQKPRRGKFTPLHLVFFQISLFNPDPWLTRQINNLHSIWTRPAAILFGIILTIATIIGLAQKAEILYQGQQLWTHQGATLILPFCFLSLLVVALHELGHAFTLKHYGGTVPEIGLQFIFFIPAAYSNTTDSYCLPRYQRVLVVAAGVLTQFIIAALALGLWNISQAGTWLHTTSYLLLVAALFTVALNLNLLAKFDGYYLAVALTGINNLRRRSFMFYSNLLRGKPIHETAQDAAILAIYAPFSLAYIWFVFGFLILKVTDWTLTNIPFTALVLLIIWVIYFYFPKRE